MSAVLSWNVPSQWTDCSIEVLEKGKFSHLCLMDKPPPHLLFGEAMCGNGLVEDGEDCDCGSLECSCCTAECTFPAGAQCSPHNGACCDDSCQIKPKGSLCRASANDCDIPEYCDGEEVVCPRNDFRHTGAECANGAGH